MSSTSPIRGVFSRCGLAAGFFVLAACTADSRRSDNPVDTDASAGTPALGAFSSTSTDALATASHVMGAARLPLALALQPSDRGWFADGAHLRTAEPKDPGRLDAVFGTLEASADKSLSVSLSAAGDFGVRLVRMGARPVAAELDRGRVVFPAAYPSTDVIVLADESRVEELLVLREGGGPTQFTWRVEASPELPQVRQESGGLVFAAADGQARLRIPQPVLVDSRGSTRDAPLEWNDGWMTIKVDPAGLAYPIVLDPAIESVVWEQRSPTAVPAKLQWHGAAFDSARHVTVVFGGQSAGARQNEVYEYDGATWTNPQPSPRPPRLDLLAMAYDNVRHQAVLFGGTDESGVFQDQTWGWNGTAWIPYCTGACTRPVGRRAHSMAFDSSRGVVVLFGGTTSVLREDAQADTWEWAGNAWTSRCDSTTCGPAKRGFAAMAYDESRGVTVLFGGVGTTASLNDTWEWNGSTWSQKCTTAPCNTNMPTTRYNHAMAYDSLRRRVVLFGGESNTVRQQDTWEWDGSTWTRTATTGPSVRMSMSLTFDSYRGRTVMYGGNTASSVTDETWEYHARGGACSSASDCDTLHCVDSVCCEVAACGTCERCDGSLPGTCTSVTSADDPDTCTGTQTCNASGQCLADLGQSCTGASQCASNFCVDSRCCESGCTTPCRSCNNATGTCSTLVTNQADNYCTGASFCDASGTCLKALGQLCSVGTECASTRCIDGRCCESSCTTACRSCANAAGTCTTVVANGVDDNCAAPNTCDSSGVCKKTQGQTCSVGSECASTFCADGRCCENACTTACRSCANTSGTCSTLVQSADDDHCTGTTTCDATATCKKDLGQTCSAGSECASTYCVDGRCCGDTCQTPCRSCANASGTCSTVVASGDDDHCSGTNTCDVAGVCKRDLGQLCGASSECASGFCADGRCCESGCTTACRSCGNPSGTCTTVVASNTDDNCAAPNSCDAVGVCKKALGQTCSGASECASGFCADGRCCENGCTTACRSCANAAGTCTTVVSNTTDDHCTAASSCDAAGVCKKANGQTCTGSGECATGSCIDGRCCADSCTTPCRSCANASGTCTTVVSSGDDDYCSGASTCNASGQCTKDLGQTCTSAGECATGNCVDGHCCESTCDTPCRSCANAAGTCTTSVAGADDDHCNGASTCSPSGDCRLRQGETCTLAGDCSSGYCVDGRCCQSACTTACRTCDNSAGTCTTLVTNADDDYCNGANMCDASGACRKDAGQTCAGDGECASAHCVDGYCCNTACAGACDRCDLASPGTCSFVAASTDGSPSCYPYTCSGASAACPTSCASDADCPSTHYCDPGDGTCKLDQGNGALCTSASQCTSAYCVEGVCCDKACAGACEACTTAWKGYGSDGVCEAVVADTDPKNACPEDPLNSCKRDGMCDGIGVCRAFSKPNVKCGDTVCVGDAVQGQLCNGAGNCVDSTGQISCEQYKCSEGACLATCTGGGDCVATAFCTSSGACMAKRTPSETCGSALECLSGFCVDGRCCNSECGQQCEACDVAGALGTCSAVHSAPHGSRAQCDTSDPICGGRCDGTDRSACAYPGAETSCGTGLCETAIFTPKLCDDKGTCIDGDPAPCHPYACDSTSQECNKVCTSDDDCATGAKCNMQTAQCAVVTDTCKDPYTVLHPNGTETSCVPYVCENGACRLLCDTNAQCASGYECVDRQCVEASDAGTGGAAGSGGSGGTGGPTSNDGSAEPAGAPASSDSGGCGCRAAPRGEGTWALVMAAAALLVTRRGKGRSQRDLDPE